MYTNYARWFCKETTGHDQTWPATYEGDCPICGAEFELPDKILVEADRVYHYDCFPGDKPEFEYTIHT